MKKIILDTNFLMIPAQYRVDIFSEIDRICDFNYEIVILDVVAGELRKIAAGMKGKTAAMLALQLLRHKNVRVIAAPKSKTLKNADEIILGIADKDNYVVATQDMALKRLLRQKKVPLIVLRQKNHLELLI